MIFVYYSIKIGSYTYITHDIIGTSNAYILLLEQTIGENWLQIEENNISYKISLLFIFSFNIRFHYNSKS